MRTFRRVVNIHASDRSILPPRKSHNSSKMHVNPVVLRAGPEQAEPVVANAKHTDIADGRPLRLGQLEGTLWCNGSHVLPQQFAASGVCVVHVILWS